MRKLFASRARKVGALTVAGLLAFAGIAVAALVLVSNYSGTATANVTQLQASDEITGVSVVNESGMDCAVSNVAAESYTIDATVSGSEVTSEDSTTETKDPVAGSCKVAVTILNTGDVALEVREPTLDQAPQGWSIGDFSWDGTNVTFQPDESITVYAVLSADNSAEGGKLEGTVRTATKS